MARRQRGRAYYNNWYQYYTRQLIELALTVYKWEGLPDSVDPRFLEEQLLRNGKVVFVKSPTIGYATLQVIETGSIDQYFTPTQRYAIAPNLQKLADIKFDNTDSVMIYNNYMRTGDLVSLDLFAQELAEIKATIHVNAQAQKAPRVFTTDDKQKLSAFNVVSKMDQWEPVIVTNNKLALGKMDVMDNSAPYVIDKLDLHEKQIWNEVMTYLSINNANQDKKERVQTAEVNANNSQVITMGLARLKAREDAAVRINRMFPSLNVRCVRRDSLFNQEDSEADKKGDDQDE